MFYVSPMVTTKKIPMGDRYFFSHERRMRIMELQDRNNLQIANNKISFINNNFKYKQFELPIQKT